VHAALVRGADGASPRVEETRVSKIPAYAQSADAMGGSCAEGPLAGLENGLACDRASDDWGLALDRRCRLTVVFPTDANKAPGARPGTFASTQRGGGTPCSTGEPRKLARRIKIAHLHGRAAELGARWRRRGYVPLRAKTKHGSASGATGVLYRLRHGHRIVIARTRHAVGLTTRPRTLRLYLVPGAKVVPGRYVSAVTARITGVRVRRGRVFTLR
jgi:hypothetical protein